MERESRRQKKDQDRARLQQEVEAHLRQEQMTRELIQSELHAARDSTNRKRSYADKAEEELKELEKMMAASSQKEDKLAIELAKLQVELAAYESKMEGARQELQRAQDLTEELTMDRNKAKEEALEMREERRRAAEQRRLDAARREGMMQGKLEGMYAGWEDGKILGYKEGRKTGAHIQHDEMRNKDWKALQRELPEYDGFEERIPSPVSTFDGDVPDPLRRLPAPIILPPQPKKPRRPAPPPETVYYDGNSAYHPQPVHSSPETIEASLPPVSHPPVSHQPVPHISHPPASHQPVSHQPVSYQPASHPPVSQPATRSQHQMQQPVSHRPEQEPRPRSRTRTNIPPPRPIFPPENIWEPPPSRPEGLQRSATQRALGAIGEKMKRKREDIVPAPEEMDFAPFAAAIPRLAMTTPLPQSQTLMPGRALATPAPSVHRDREPDRYRYGDSEEEFDRDRQRQWEQQEEQQPAGPFQNKGFLSRLNSALRGGPTRPTVDTSNHPLAYQDVQQTPHMERLESVSPSPSPSPGPSPGARSVDYMGGNRSMRSVDMRSVDYPAANRSMQSVDYPDAHRSMMDYPVPTPAPLRPPPLPHPRPTFQDIFVPSLDAQGKFTLPPPHEMGGSAMESAINGSQNPSRNPSRNPSPSPSNRSHQRSRSRDIGRDHSPGRLSHLGGSIRKTASAVIHAVPSRSKIRDEYRGRSRGNSPARSQSPDPIQIARERSRERSPIRPRSGIGLPNSFVEVPEHGLLRPEHIRVGPSISGTTVSEMTDNNSIRGRDPIRQGTGTSYASVQGSPGGISRMSILSNGALGLSRGGDAHDVGFVTYPNASATNLSMIEEERARQSGYNPSPAPGFRQSMQENAPIAPAEFFPPRPPGSQRQYSDNSIREYGDGRPPWDETSRYPPPPPSIRSQASGPPPQPPAKSPRSTSHPWQQRPVPSKVIMPSLLSAQSPAPSSRGGIAGIGAGGGFHKRALSASAMSPGVGHNFASPNPSATRLVCKLLRSSSMTLTSFSRWLAHLQEVIAVVHLLPQSHILPHLGGIQLC